MVGRDVTADIHDSLFEQNACHPSSGYGAAIHSDRGVLTLARNRFLGNQNVSTLSLSQGRLTSVDDVFLGNAEDTIYSGADKVDINRGTFGDNARAAIIGAGSATSQITVTNSILYGNGDGVLIYAGRAGLRHCTLVGHTSHAVRSRSSAQAVTVTNSIFAGNAYAIRVEAGTHDVSYCLFSGNTQQPITGSHAVTEDPLFVDAAGDDYHLQKTSPAIDKGVNLGIARDYDNERRPYGSAPDIGADEVKTIISLFLPLVRR